MMEWGPQSTSWQLGGEGPCHTCFSQENQVHNYMHARIKFHAHSDI
jgi:hypothetical protein